MTPDLRKHNSTILWDVLKGIKPSKSRARGTNIILTGPNLTRQKLALKSNQGHVSYGNELKKPTWKC